MKVWAFRKRSGCSDSSSFSRTEAGSWLQIWLKEHCSSWTEVSVVRLWCVWGFRPQPLVTLESW